MKKHALLSLICLTFSILPASAAVVIKVDKSSRTYPHFKVTQEKDHDEIRITVKVPARTMEGVLDSLRYSTGERTRIVSNGTQLQFVIHPSKLENAIVYVDYTDPNHNPEETGGCTVYMLNVSELLAEAGEK